MNATPVLTCENLTLNDCNVLRTALGMQRVHTPEQFAEEHPDLAQVWHTLRHTTQVPVMIACAALRGRTTKLPPDPRLAPKPHAPLNHAPKRTPGTPAAPRRAPASTKPAWTQDHAVLAVVVPNPKKPGTAAYERFKHYVVGRTVAELLSLGVTRGDLSWDGQRQFVTFALPED